MTWQLCKELYEAGWRNSHEWFKGPHDEILPAVTLEELLATFYGNVELKKEAGQWYCKELPPTKLSEPYVGVGGEPEIAVARLWLALNKKDAH